MALADRLRQEAQQEVTKIATDASPELTAALQALVAWNESAAAIQNSVKHCENLLRQDAEMQKRHNAHQSERQQKQHDKLLNSVQLLNDSNEKLIAQLKSVVTTDLKGDIQKAVQSEIKRQTKALREASVEMEKIGERNMRKIEKFREFTLSIDELQKWLLWGGQICCVLIVVWFVLAVVLGIEWAVPPWLRTV